MERIKKEFFESIRLDGCGCGNDTFLEVALKFDFLLFFYFFKTIIE